MLAPFLLRRALREYLSGASWLSDADESGYFTGTELLVDGAVTAL